MTAAEEAAILGGHDKPGKIVTLFPGTGTVGNLNAKEVRLPDTTHDSMPDDVAAYLRGR